MLLCEYTFCPREDVATHALEDEVHGLLGALSKNGQIWGEEVVGHEGGDVKVWLNVPRPDALSEKHRTEWVCQAHDRVVAMCRTAPVWRVVDDRASKPRGETWREGAGMYLFTHMFDKTSPVCAGHTGEQVPLYLLPIAQEVREKLFVWARTYRTHDELQIGSGPLEIPAYRQLAEVGSELSETGRSLCRTLEHATGQATYYYLMCYWGRDEQDAERRCPGCGGEWATPAPEDAKGLAWFDFRCEPCRLVSHLAVSFESKAKAAIGEWRHRNDTGTTGGCFCSALTFAIHAPLVGAQSCHCSRCRKVFSGAGSAFAFLAADSFEWTCKPRALRRYASGNGWEIGFCGRCGSTLCGIHEGTVKGVTLGTIDGDPGIQLQRHIFVGSKAPWDHIGGDAPQFEEDAES